MSLASRGFRSIAIAAVGGHRNAPEASLKAKPSLFDHVHKATFSTFNEILRHSTRVVKVTTFDLRL